MSADGFIGRSNEDLSTQWTSEDDRRCFVQLTKAAGTIIVGRDTFETFPKKPLPGRLNIVYTHDKRLLDTASTDELLYTSADPKKLLTDLKNHCRTHVMICGGTSIYGLFLPFVSTFHITTEPVFLGRGIHLFNTPLAKPKELRLIDRVMSQTGTTFSEYACEPEIRI